MASTMEPERLDGFLGGYVAGYAAALDEEVAYHPSNHLAQKEGLSNAVEALERQGTECLKCGRDGVVILDGYFCERCSPGIAEVAREVLEDDA